MSGENPTTNNYETFNYFFGTLIASCCLVIILPKMSNNPNTLLFCYFFIALSITALFLNWFFKEGAEKYKSKMLAYLLPPLLFIIVSVFSSFIMISSYKDKIQSGSVTNYYYKFNLISIWLILIECYLLWQLYVIISTNKGNNRLYMFGIICFCAINYFVIASNSIGLAHFSADG